MTVDDSATTTQAAPDSPVPDTPGGIRRTPTGIARGLEKLSLDDQVKAPGILVPTSPQMPPTGPGPVSSGNTSPSPQTGSEPDISLDTRALQQLEEQQKGLLDTVDSLRTLGVGQLISLPQIIVVGDQSSGKSSVLEAISRVRFPVKDGLCTRFATELVLRKSGAARVDVSIRRNARDTSYRPFKETNFSREDLPRIIEEASKHMNCDASGGGFSEDLLTVTIYGPDIPQLTLVDLPGIYHAGNEMQSEHGSQVVNRLIEKYMASPNSIILAIISARNEVVLQQVLSKARKFDPNRQRTLGIITKPDTVAPGSREEERFIRLARNRDKTQTLAHGWHVLRNRKEGEESLSDAAGDANEAGFFASGNWVAVPTRDRGIEMLRQKLSKILLSKIEENMPDLICKIEENVRERETKLLELGESRSTPSEHKAFLVNVSQKFHSLAYNAIIGHYNDEFFGGLEEQNRVLKLRALVRDLNRAFDFVLDVKGSRRKIVSDEDEEDEEVEIPGFLKPFVDSYPIPSPTVIRVDDLCKEIENSAAANQGIEFSGSSNDQLALDLFRDQSRNWEKIAKHHLSVVTDVCRVFVETLLRHVSREAVGTCNALLRDFVDPYFEAKEAQLQKKLGELLFHYRTGFGVCLDNDFRQRQGQREKKRLAKLVSKTLRETRPDLFERSEKPSKLDEKSLERSIIDATYLEETYEFGADRVIDLSVSYYELSQRTFAENVIVLSIENCLIRDIPQILSPNSFQALEDDELKFLAAEPPDVQQTRQELRSELKALKAGLRLCQRSNNSRVQAALPTSIAGILTTSERKPVAVPSIFQTNSGQTPASRPLFQNVPDLGKPTGSFSFSSMSSTPSNNAQSPYSGSFNTPRKTPGGSGSLNSNATPTRKPGRGILGTFGVSTG